MKPARRLARCLAVAACVVLAATCDSSPTGPRGVGERVAVGSTITGTTTPSAPAHYSFVAENDGEYAVFLAASGGTVQLSVLDSTHGRLAGFVTAGPTTGPLLTNATQNFTTTLGTVFDLTVNAVPLASTAFEFQVFAVNSAPEQQPAQFVIGDTVQGEDLSPLVDVDNFSAHGQAGEQIVVVVEPLGPAGAGPLALVVRDSSTFLGNSTNDAGNASPHTSSWITLPATADYLFQVRSFTNGVDPRFSGPYRFWSYAINRAPEHRPAALPLGVVVSGERIDRAGDIDEFFFQATAGQDYDAFVQSTRAMELQVAPASGLPIAEVVANTTDTGLFSAGTGRFTVTQGGPYLARVVGTASTDQADTGAYRFLLYPIDPRPEHIPATIVAGDTVSGESIDMPGDVDEFPVPGGPGDEYNAFIQARTSSPLSPIELEVVNDSGTVLGAVVSSVNDASLTQQQSGRFVIPGAGGLRLRVSGALSAAGRDTGAYRLYLYRVNRKPEHVSDTLVFGDSVLGERIDLPGDVDEYQVIVPDSSGANLLVQLDSAATDTPLRVSLLDSTGHAAPDLVVFTLGGFTQTSTFLIRPGKYILRVQGSYDRSAYIGGYRVWFYKFRFGPEVAPDTIAIGDTISSEGLDPPGDIDVFSVFGQRGDHINIALQGLGVAGNGEFLGTLTAPGQPPSSFVVSPEHADSLGAYQTNRIDLAQTGWYQLSISAYSSPNLHSGGGPYRYAITRWSTAPEQVGAALVPGDSVTGEAMDYPWDWDEFTVTGAPGQMLAVVSRTLSGSGSAYLIVFDSTTGDTLAKWYPQAFDTPTARFTLPANGHAELAVYSQGFVGAYRFTVVPVNPAPEKVPAAFALGDTVRGEAIAPATDLDEFTGVGTPGETLAPWWRLTADPVPAGGLMSLQIVDPATGAVLVGSNVSIFATTPEFFTPGQFTVPASGNFVVRIRAYYDNDMTTAPYEFFVAPVP